MSSLRLTPVVTTQNAGFSLQRSLREEEAIYIAMW